MNPGIDPCSFSISVVCRTALSLVMRFVRWSASSGRRCEPSGVVLELFHSTWVFALSTEFMISETLFVRAPRAPRLGATPDYRLKQVGSIPEFYLVDPAVPDLKMRQVVNP